MRQIVGKEWTFHVPTDFDPDEPVIARPNLAESDIDAIEIPMADIEKVVAAKARWRRENELIDLDDQELLYG